MQRDCFWMVLWLPSLLAVTITNHFPERSGLYSIFLHFNIQFSFVALIGWWHHNGWRHLVPECRLRTGAVHQTTLPLPAIPSMRVIWADGLGSVVSSAKRHRTEQSQPKRPKWYKSSSCVWASSVSADIKGLMELSGALRMDRTQIQWAFLYCYWSKAYSDQRMLEIPFKVICAARASDFLSSCFRVDILPVIGPQVCVGWMNTGATAAPSASTFN